MAHCIPTYMLASGLIAAGMNWWQALLTILLGNTIVLVPILLNSHPGHEVRHPVPGLRARRLRHDRLEPAGADARDRRVRLVRHPGVDRRRGAAHVLRQRHSRLARRCSAPASAAITTTEWLSFLLFWGLNIFIIYRGMDLLRQVENWAAPFVLVMTAAAARLGGLARARPRPAARRSRASSRRCGEFWPGLRPVADGDDRLLGDAVAEHARLHPLRPQPARAGRSARSSRCRRR